MSLESLADASWPVCWLFANRTDGRGGTTTELGTRMTRDQKSGGFTYQCPCGETFTRAAQGDQNEEARAWVSRHVRHLEDEAR